MKMRTSYKIYSLWSCGHVPNTCKYDRDYLYLGDVNAAKLVSLDKIGNKKDVYDKVIESQNTHQEVRSIDRFIGLEIQKQTNKTTIKKYKEVSHETN